MSGRTGIPYGERLPHALILELRRANNSGLGWMRIAYASEIDPVTLRRARRGLPVTRVTRERIERFIEAQKRKQAA
jgi:hypothetical protein